MEEVLEDGVDGEEGTDGGDNDPPLVNGISYHGENTETNGNMESRVNGLTNPSNRQTGNDERRNEDEDDEGIYL